MSETSGEELDSAHGGPGQTVGGDDGEQRAYEPTGNPTVDSVLESLARLDGTPAAEHVSVFESAHERLREALADAGNDDPAS